jgi:hypothetical protein
MRLLLLCALICIWPLANVLALEPREADLVPIGTVLADPQGYNLHRVRFQGTIKGITPLLALGGCSTVNAYRFQFEDDTGSIEVFDNGSCIKGKAVPPILAMNPAEVGERISIVATVIIPHAPGPLLHAKLEWIGRLR